MYQIDKSLNRIKPLTVKKFSDLGFTERGHLQEWLANESMALGEELLIIQKEFDGFDDTNERLDLLALDKDGNLVVIENKLDDSGRDVVWQALKYASYCSTLKKNQIVEIFQKYLAKTGGDGDAQALICEFLEVPDLAEVVLNSGNQQRIMFVAAQFRKEVTSTVLWLLSHNIQLQCFKATPYGMGDNLFLKLEQIIPTPEATEFMIGINEKEAAEKTAEFELKSRHKIRLAFWQQALDALKASSTDLYNNISPSKDHWIYAGSGMSGCPFDLIFGSKFIRVELVIARTNKVENKFIFDYLVSKKSQIEEAFGDALSWDRLDDKKSSSIRFGHDVDGFNRDNWPGMVNWMVEHIIKLEAALKKPLADAVKALKTEGIETPSYINGDDAC
ncbi:DUF4268 domain-containing protein [Geomonas ferrireducens]|uniref:DUF4268 domain-containing protein n=1 Tax=Geomonas ferrireducens TaxID=2570227 RepID=UPI0010A934F8|nr:DUF4268 domain-containing protein [Geomonas ferrireducens]